MPRQIKPYRRIIAAYLILLAAGIPWYWPEGNTARLFGLPAWVTIAIIVSVLASVLTAFILFYYRWPGEGGEDDRPEEA